MDNRIICVSFRDAAYGWVARSDPAHLVTDRFQTGRLTFDATTAHERRILGCVRSRRDPGAAETNSHRKLDHA